MKAHRNCPKGTAGEVSLRFLIVAAALCVGFYFYSRPKPAPPVVAAIPAVATPLPATPVPATPPPAPPVAEPLPEPPPEPVVVEAAPPPLDLATVERTPALWPKQVALLQPVVFPLMKNGRPIGHVTAPAGSMLRLHRVAAQQVDVEFQYVRQFIPASATDLMPRALAAHRAAEAATAAAAQTASAEPVAGQLPASAPVAPQAIPAVGKFPELRVQAMVGTSQRRSGTSSYMKEQTIKPKCVIAGASQISAIPALEATMVVVTMATAAKYVAGDESYFVQTAEKLPVEPAANGASRTYQFAETTVRYDSWRDSTNVGGRTYKYFVFGLTDPATKKLIYFQTNCPELATHCKTNPDKRLAVLRMTAGSKFPSKF